MSSSYALFRVLEDEDDEGEAPSSDQQSTWLNKIYSVLFTYRVLSVNACLVVLSWKGIYKGEGKKKIKRE